MGGNFENLCYYINELHFFASFIFIRFVLFFILLSSMRLIYYNFPPNACNQQEVRIRNTKLNDNDYEISLLF